MSHRNRDNQVGKWKMRSRLPTQCYLDIANSGYTILPDADLKLVILDLNGTLVWRPKSATSARIPKLRPGLATFIPYLMSNFAVMIWSSSAPHSVTAMCNEIFTQQQRQQLVAVWARDTLGLTSRDYNSKVQTYKDLDVVWKSSQVRKVKKFSQRDTIIIDDSLEKLKEHPFNLIPVPEYTKESHESGQDTALRSVMEILESLRYCGNVSGYLAHNKPEFAIAATLEDESTSNTSLPGDLSSR